MNIESLLEELERVPLDSIEPYPDNPRRGNVGAIVASLKKNLQYRPIVVQRSTRYILAGNHTYLAAVEWGWTHIDAVFIDVDDEHAKRIVLVDNRTADLGDYDDLLLAAILGEIREEDEMLLEGTGYDTDEVDNLIADALTYEMPDPEEDPEGAAAIAKIFERIAPHRPAEDEVALSVDNTKEILEDVGARGFGRKQAVPPPPEEPTEYVIFRFGELRAKIPRTDYDEFQQELLLQYDGDAVAAGLAAAELLGINPDHIRPAVAEGTERWA